MCSLRPWSVKPMCSSIIAPARSTELGSAYWARPSFTMRGALPWIASNIACRLPRFALPAVPTPPWICAASSVRMSPYRFGITSTWKSARRSRSSSFAVIMSMYQASRVMSGYSWLMLWAMFRNLPSVVLTMFALVTTVTRLFPVRAACSNAARTIRSAPCVVMTRKSMARSAVTLMPWLPTAYRSSVFSRKNVQSMPSCGMRTGRTLAKRSSSLRIDTFALSRFGQGSPASGVCVGPLRTTWQALISASTSSGIDFPWAARFSIVSPAMSRNSTVPASTCALSRWARTRCESPVMVRPDTVAAYHPDDERPKRLVVQPRLGGLEPLHPLQLFAHELAEVFPGRFDDLTICHCGVSPGRVVGPSGVLAGCDEEQRVSPVRLGARCEAQLLHDAVRRRWESVFHLHGLQHDDGFARLDCLAFFDGVAQHDARHGGRDRDAVPAGGRRAAGCGAVAATGGLGAARGGDGSVATAAGALATCGADGAGVPAPPPSTGSTMTW